MKCISPAAVVFDVFCCFRNTALPFRFFCFSSKGPDSPERFLLYRQHAGPNANRILSTKFAFITAGVDTDDMILGTRGSAGSSFCFGRCDVAVVLVVCSGRSVANLIDCIVGCGGVVRSSKLFCLSHALSTRLRPDPTGYRRIAT